MSINKIDVDSLPEEYKEIYKNTIMPVDTNIKLEQVILSDENKKKISRFKHEIEMRDTLRKYGLEPMNRVLLYGASGTGKTFMTKALSNELGFTMLYIDISRALTEGNVARNISDIFRLANYLENCIIFLDECDSVAWRRNDVNNNDSANIRRATNSIFQNLDQMSYKNLFFAATNLVDSLDDAFRRRFNLEMRFYRPQLNLDESIKHFLNPMFQLLDDEPKKEKEVIQRRAYNSESLSYYAIENAVKEGEKKSVLSGSNIVSTSGIYQDLMTTMHFTLNTGNAITRDDVPKKYQDIWDNVIMHVDTNISLDSVILSDENKKKILRFLKEVEYRDKLIEYGLEPQNRILMYGASGTGKTFLSKALSNTLGYTMLYVDISKSLSEGNVSQNISDIFTLGNYIETAIIFLDECDSVAWNRDAGNADNGVIRRATNTIFQNLDQMNQKCIFIAATNMLHRLDAAFERRFNVKMKFTRPELDIDEAIHHFMYPKFRIIDNTPDDIKEIVKKRAKQNAKLSYYEIEEIVKEGMKRAVLNDTDVVYTLDIYNDLQTSMHFKIKHQTGDDDPEIFRNNSSYDPAPDEEIYI